MDFKKNLEKYAKLIVEIGSNVKKGDIVNISCPVERADFGRLLTKYAYLAGASEVVIDWNDEEINKLMWEYTPEEVMKDIPQYLYDRYEYYAKKGQKSIGIHASNPELLKDIDPGKIQRVSKVRGEKFKPLVKYSMNDINSWTVISVPTKSWAEKVFPKSEKPIKDLWNAIFETTRINDEDPIKSWKAHLSLLSEKANWLNEQNFKSLKYKASNGTDLEIGLPKGHIWTAASSINSKGDVFVPNMPTEEVFTLPHRERVNGRVYSSKPLVLNGNIVDKFWLEFKDGEVVDFDAKVGKDTLGHLFEQDQRAKRLGEVALVPYDSPISNSNILFFNTLFDENASCHLALGKAYPTTIKGGVDMTDDELLENGVNDSLAHEDFMIGTSDLDIIGIKYDGTEVQVFKNGNWA